MPTVYKYSSKNGAYVKGLSSSYSNNWKKGTSSPKKEVSAHIAEAGYKKGKTSASVKTFGASASVGIKTGGEAYLAKYEASREVKVPFTNNKKIKVSGEATLGLGAGVTFDPKKGKYGVKLAVGAGGGFAIDLKR